MNILRRIHNLIFVVVFLSVILSIIFNTVLEIGYNVQKSPYARFIVKGGSAVYDFLTNKGVDIVKGIIYLLSSSVCLALLLFAISALEAFISKELRCVIQTFVSFILFIFLAFLVKYMLGDYGKIYTGASYFYLYYLLIVLLLLVLSGMKFQFLSRTMELDSKTDLFNFKKFLCDMLVASFVSILSLFIIEYILLLAKRSASFLNWKDVAFSFCAVVSISFFTSLLYFIAFAIIFYLLYMVFKLCNIELFILISAFFVAIFTIMLIYFWGFNYIRSKTPIFNFIPSLSLTVLLYSFSAYPIAYILFNCLRTISYNNLLPSLLISVSLGWVVQIPLQLISGVIPTTRKYMFKIIVISSIIVCIGFIYRIIYSLYNEKYLSHAYVVTYVISRYLAIIVIFATFLLLQLLKISDILKKLVSCKMLFIYSAIAVVGYGLFGLRENVRFLLIRKSEIIGSAIKTLREVTDFDRDEFSTLFYGGDRSEFNKKDNPYFRSYFETEIKTAPVKNGYDVFNPAGNNCNKNVMVDKSTSHSKPNLIFILLDGGRRDMLGVYGNKNALTPNIDSFAMDSVVFKNAYANTSISIIYDNIFFTGHYSIKNIARKPEFPHLIERLCNLKLYSYYVFPYYWTNFLKMCEYTQITVLDGNFTKKFQKLYKKPGETSSVLFNSAIELIDNDVKDRRFFMYLTLFDTHFPFDENYTGGKVYGSTMSDIYKNHVNYMDNYFGEFINELKEKGLYDNSIIVVYADHGSELKEHGRVYHGYHLYSESVNIPFIVKIPGVRHKEIDVPMSYVDFLPTLLNLLGICPENEKFDGQDFSPLILDDSSSFIHNSSFSIHNSVVKNDLIFMYDGLEDRYALLYKNRYKLIYNRTENVFELYDLTSDPGEIKNVADVEGDIFKKLKYVLFDFLYKGFHIYGDVSIFKKVPEQ